MLRKAMSDRQSDARDQRPGVEPDEPDEHAHPEDAVAQAVAPRREHRFHVGRRKPIPADPAERPTDHRQPPDRQELPSQEDGQQDERQRRVGRPWADEGQRGGGDQPKGDRGTAVPGGATGRHRRDHRRYGADCGDDRQDHAAIVLRRCVGGHVPNDEDDDERRRRGSRGHAGLP